MRKQLHKLMQTNPRVARYAGVVLACLLMLVLFRLWGAVLLRYQTDNQAIPIVNTITAQRTPGLETIILPGTISAWHEAPIYARTHGYVKEWYVDIGYKVKKGDILALIETPELDAQLRQAEATLNVAIANDQLAQITAVRWVNLLKTNSVSKQETDEKTDTAKATAAKVLAARANRDRLQELVQFEKVVAPFSGTISARTTDIGALINIGSKPSEARPLFRIVQQDPLRLYVKIPENYSARISPNMVVQLTLAEYPGQFFPAKLFKTADAIDPVTRTLLAQFIVQNKAGRLLPGGYTEVYFHMPPLPNAVRVPVNTLLFRSAGLQIATLNQQQRVVLKSVVISRDEGDMVEIGSGIKPGEQLIVNPSDSLFNGQRVKVVNVAFNNPVLGTA